MQLTKLHITLLLLLALCVPRASAALAQAILYTTDTSGTNARPSAVTITPSTGGTNLSAGALNATNHITSGGYLSLSGTTNRLTVAGDELLLDGVSVGGGGDTIWTNDNGTISATTDTAFINNLMLSNSASGVKFYFDAFGTIVTEGTEGSGLSAVGPDTFFDLHDPDDPTWIFYVDGHQFQLNGTDPSSGYYYTWFRPTAPDDGTVPYTFDVDPPHSSGLLARFRNDETNRFTIDWTGKAEAEGGFSSTATDAAVTIASTGWTNTFGKNAVVYMDGVGLTYTVYDNALTPVYTNSVTVVNATVILQPSGKVIITDGTLGVGRATPF